MNALFDTGELITVLKMLDSDGNETDDPDEAVSALLETPDGIQVVDLSEFTVETIH